MTETKVKLIDEVLALVGKPFRLADQSENPKAIFRLKNSSRVVWIEEKLNYGEDKWMFHCQLIVMDDYIAAYATFLDSSYEKRLTLNDFVWL